MHNSAASKVMEPIDPEPADGVPGPVSNYWVDESSDHDRVDNVGHKVAPLSQWTRHQRGRSGGKHKVEEPLGQLVVWKFTKYSLCIYMHAFEKHVQEF